MNLCDRLQTPTPLGWGCRYMYTYRGIDREGKQDLIKEVAERYSTRFGPLKIADARKLYERLAKRYSSGPGVGVILRALYDRYDRRDESGFGEYAHPKHMAEYSFRMNWARLQVKEATENHSGAYGIRGHPYGSDRLCRFCGSPCFYTVVDKTGLRHLARRMTKGAYGVCRNAMCKAFVAVFPVCKSEKKRLPMAYVLMELTKNGDRSGKVREVEEIAARDIYKTHNWRNRQKGSKSSSGIGISV